MLLLEGIMEPPTDTLLHGHRIYNKINLGSISLIRIDFEACPYFGRGRHHWSVTSPEALQFRHPLPCVTESWLTPTVAETEQMP